MSIQLQTPERPAHRRVKLSAAADYAGVHRQTLRRRIADGSLAGYRLGARVILVDLDDVDALFESIPAVGRF